MRREFIEAGRRGGQARARKLSPERRREIAIEASLEAARKRHQGITVRQEIAAYIARVKSENAELGRVIELVLQSPPRYYDAMARCLPQVLAADEMQLATEIGQATLEEVQV